MERDNAVGRVLPEGPCRIAGETVQYALCVSMRNSPEDNDPHGEHDFGDLDLDGEKLFGKIDCYDPARPHDHVRGQVLTRSCANDLDHARALDTICPCPECAEDFDQWFERAPGPKAE